jgi:hypothetical protein
MVGDIQHIIIIQSLEPDEKQTGAELYDDVVNRRIEQLGDLSFIKSQAYFSADSKAEILAVLDNILNDINNRQNGLVIHFEMHGSSHFDGLITADGELISWLELVTKFRPINIATQNQLYLTMATCYGRYLFEAVDPELKSPYSGYISASQSVTVQEVMDSFGDVFERLIADGNLIRSYLASDAEGGRFFYKDSKTTFEQLMEHIIDRMRNDPSFKEEVLDHPALIMGKNMGIIDDAGLDYIMGKALADIYQRHKKAFEFQ